MITADTTKKYTLVVSCFSPGDTGTFELTVSSICDFKLEPLPLEGEGKIYETIDGEWKEGLCGGTTDYYQNPTYMISTAEPTSITMRLTSQEKVPPYMNLSLLTSSGKVQGK